MGSIAILLVLYALYHPCVTHPDNEVTKNRPVFD